MYLSSPQNFTMAREGSAWSPAQYRHRDVARANPKQRPTVAAATAWGPRAVLEKALSSPGRAQALQIPL